MSADGWKSIETAPEREFMLLAYPAPRGGEVEVSEGYHSGDGIFTVNNIGVVPTHWMPLPKPPAQPPR